MRYTAFLLSAFLLCALSASAVTVSKPIMAFPQTTTHSVTLTWTASATPNVTYNLKRSTTSGSGYVTLENTAALTLTDTNVQPGTTYFYVVSAMDALGNESVNSAQVSAAIPGITPPPPACTTVAANSWLNTAFASQSGQFSIDFDATPASAAVDAIAGASNGAATGFTSLGPIVWFSNVGTVQARNGAAYTATFAYKYSANVSYHVRMAVNVATHTYSAWIHTGTAAETQIANGYAFRTEQATVTALNNFGVFVNAGSPTIQACNFALSGAAPPPPPPVTISIAPTTKTLVEGATQQFAAAVANATDTSATWTSTGGTVSATGLFTAGIVPGPGSVTATSVADHTKSAKATITITAPPPVITLNCLGLSTQNIPSGTSITLSATGGGGSATAVCPVP